MSSTLTEHITMAREALQDNFGGGIAQSSAAEADAGMGALRTLASFILALHPELAQVDEDAQDELLESLVEVINEEITDNEFLARLAGTA